MASARVPEGSRQVIRSPRSRISWQNDTDDGRQVLEGKVSRPETLDVGFDFVDHLLGITRNPPRRPHIGRRAIRALIGTPAGGEHRHGDIGGVLTAKELVSVVGVDLEVVPCRLRQIVDRDVATTAAIDHDLPTIPVGDAGNVGDRPPLRESRHELDHCLFSLAKHQIVRRGGHQGELRHGGDVLASEQDREIRPRRLDQCDESSGGRPLMREGHRNPDRSGAGRNPLDDLLQGQAEQVALEVAGMDRRSLADRIDDVHRKAGPLQCSGNVAQAERQRDGGRCKPNRVDGGRTDEANHRFATECTGRTTSREEGFGPGRTEESGLPPWAGPKGWIRGALRGTGRRDGSGAPCVCRAGGMSPSLPARDGPKG